MSSQGQPRAALAQVAADVVAVEFSDAQIERLADLLAERLQVSPAPAGPVAARLVSAEALARELGVSRAHVYAHAAELGAIRLGKGPRARLRFDPDAARAALACYVSKQSPGSDVSTGAESAAPQGRRGRRLPNRLPEPGSVLAVRPRSGA